MDLPEYRSDALETGIRGRYRIPVMRLPDGSDLWLPVMSVNGGRPGPTLALLAGVHGDEYEGIRAIPEALAALNPDTLSGRVVAVPVCNPPAYRTAQRCSPVDGLNLARTFPGDPLGTASERIAACLTEQVIARADFLIDLHSAGITYSMPTLVGYPHEETRLGRASREAALAFGCDVVWGHPPDPTATGRTISAAGALGVPWLYAEAPGGARTRPEDVACYVRGVLNVMRCLGMLPGSVDRCIPRLHLLGAGNLDRPIRAGASGYFITEVELLEEVRQGQRLGRILDPFGEIVEELDADRDGRVVMTRGLPMIHAGEGAFLITGTLA